MEILRYKRKKEIKILKNKISNKMECVFVELRVYLFLYVE